MLGSRVVTAAILLAGFLFALFFASSTAWRLLCLGVLAAAAWEWARLCRLRWWTATGFCLLCAVLTFWLTGEPPRVPWSQSVSAMVTVLWLLATPPWLWRRPATPDAVLALAGAVVLPVAFASLVTLRAAGSGLLLAVLCTIWISDTAAYFTGRWCGRRKLAPAISPGKTWEGVWGALAAVLLYASAVSLAVPAVAGLPAGYFVAAAVALSLLGILGDLFESQMKRRVGVKDSGRILPGHGGVLDRIDALLPVLPAACWLFGQ